MKTGRGFTLLEMLIVVALVSLMAGITFPSISAGVDSLRLASASDQTVALWNAALNRAERRQQVVEVTIAPGAGALALRSTEAGFTRELKLPDGVRVVKILPEGAAGEDGPRRFYLYPGGAPPRVGLLLRNQRGVARWVRVDPITGVARIELEVESE